MADETIVDVGQQEVALEAELQSVVSPTAAWKAILGDNVIDRRGAVFTVPSVTHGRQIIGLYFSSSEYESCSEFTQQLATWYHRFKSVSERRDDLEFIFISNDHSAAAFDKSLSEIPWYAVPMDKANLAMRHIAPVSLPTLAFVNGNGEILSMDGREIITGEPDPTKFPFDRIALENTVGAKVRSVGSAMGSGCVVLTKCAGKQGVTGVWTVVTVVTKLVFQFLTVVLCQLPSKLCKKTKKKTEAGVTNTV